MLSLVLEGRSQRKRLEIHYGTEPRHEPRSRSPGKGTADFNRSFAAPHPEDWPKGNRSLMQEGPPRPEGRGAKGREMTQVSLPSSGDRAPVRAWAAGEAFRCLKASMMSMGSGKKMVEAFLLLMSLMVCR